VIAAMLFAVVVASDAPLDNPRSEARAQELMREIRCVVCENEPVSQSTAEVAIDMRRTIREQVAAGAGDGQIRDFFAQRYGDKVLFRPRSSGGWMLIWLFPFVLLAGVAGLILARARKPKSASLPPLAEDEVGESKP
jgi:cytochrome c-type biogenesis protein CcmH